MNIDERILSVIRAMGFTKPTEVQEKTIPIAMQGKDVIGQSMTGSGKTIAFAVPLLHSIEKHNGVQALILVPTRELAEQVANHIEKLAKNMNFRICKVYGGVSISPQIEQLRFSEIVVGTPGRILDHMNRRTIDFSRVKVLVLDEADRMLDMGFIDDIEKIIRHIPKKRQTMLFSATMPNQILRIAHRYMHNPMNIKAEITVPTHKLRQYYYDVKQDEKFSLLAHLIKKEKPNLAIVFCSTKRTTDIVARLLAEQGIDAKAIHGDLSQQHRSRVIEGFHKGKSHILVATDVASRGLDIKDVTHVFNFDVPRDLDSYTHRIGRTARAGESGKAVSLLGQRDHESFRRLLRESPSKIVREEAPKFERVQVQMADRSQGPRRGPPRFGNRGGGFGSGNRGRARPSSDWRGSPKRHHGGFDRR